MSAMRCGLASLLIFVVSGAFALFYWHYYSTYEQDYVDRVTASTLKQMGEEKTGVNVTKDGEVRLVRVIVPIKHPSTIMVASMYASTIVAGVSGVAAIACFARRGYTRIRNAQAHRHGE